ncbi:hypothetical protein HPB47_004161 [Ixodes persulcatus]|uniref:Uncharacterized protein n=1 Tax=Ixodes persulcatus TaxID=34615 RepID=A0AC60PGG0_IXOPE|nr:hypothetical protein HPB47_004161 [Ixodes persulcatus]
MARSATSVSGASSLLLERDDIVARRLSTALDSHAKLLKLGHCSSLYKKRFHRHDLQRDLSHGDAKRIKRSDRHRLSPVSPNDAYAIVHAGALSTSTEFKLDVALSVNSINRYVDKACETSRCLIETEDVDYAGHFVECAVATILGSRFSFVAFVRQTTAIAGAPHEVKITICRSEVDQASYSCKAVHAPFRGAMEASWDLDATPKPGSKYPRLLGSLDELRELAVRRIVGLPLEEVLRRLQKSKRNEDIEDIKRSTRDQATSSLWMRHIVG